MPHRSFSSIVAMSLFLFASSARSQEAAPVRGLDESASAAVRKKAIDLLESVAGQVDSLRSAENRARIRSNIGELLWTHDEKRSRTLFALVEEDLKTGFNEADEDDPTPNQTLMVFWKLRTDTLDRIAKHDPVFALEFLRATPPPPHIQLPHHLRDAEKFLELRLAGQVAAKNPELALKLGRESLAKGFSPELPLVLGQLRWKDKAATLSFSEAIVMKLKSANLAHDQGAMDIALYLAHSFQPPEVDEQVYRELIGILLASALANDCSEGEPDNAPYICHQIASVFSKMEGYYGSRAAPLKRWAGRGVGYSVPQVPPQIREVIENGTIDEMLALALKHPDLQPQLHWKAMTKALASGDTAQARKIASNFPDEEQRRYMLAQIDREQQARSVDAGKLAAIQQELSRLPNGEERIQFLLYRALQIGGTDRKAALGLLSQAGQILASTKPAVTQLEGQIALAMMYCSLKSDRGFTIIESLIPRFNELVAASATLDGFGHNYLRNGEWNMSGEGDVGRLLNAVAENAGFFAAQDFDRSVNLASQMERPELRLMAKLKIAQGVLGKSPNRALMFQTSESLH